MRQILSSAPGWDQLDAEGRRGAHEVLHDIVAGAQRAGVVLCLVTVAGEDDGSVFIGSLALGWVNAEPMKADAPLARLMAGQADLVTDFDTPLGPAVLRCEVIDPGRPWGALFRERRAYSAQAFLPVRGTTWLAVVTGTGSSERRAELIEKLVRRMTGSIRLPDGGAPSAAATTSRLNLTIRTGEGQV